MKQNKKVTPKPKRKTSVFKSKNVEQTQETLKSMPGDPITIKELELIKKCCDSVGELYKFLGVQKNSTKEFIKKKLNKTGEELRLNYSKTRNSKDMKIIEKKIDDWILAFNVLDDPRLRFTYDNEFYNNMIEKEKQTSQSSKDILESGEGTSVLPKLLTFLNLPIQLIQNNMISRSSQNTATTIKSMIKEGKLLFFKGSILGIGSSIIHYYIENAVNNISDNRIKSIFKDSLIYITTYPLKWIFECISVAPLSMSIIHIIKKIILREDQSYQFKNLFYSISSSILLYSTKKLVIYSMDNIENFVKIKFRMNPNSKLWKYVSILYCNSITQGVLTALLISPIQVTRLKYPIEFVQSFITNTPIPKVINPISMAIKINNQYGYSKFYDGLHIGIIYFISQHFQRSNY